MVTKTLRAFTQEDVVKHNMPDDLWIIIDNNLYDLSWFKYLYPGSAAVLLADDIPDQDVTEPFYSLHRHEVLKRPTYRRLHIGTIKGEKSMMTSGEIGQLGQVPYAEPTWLSARFYSAYYKEVRGMLFTSVIESEELALC